MAYHEPANDNELSRTDWEDEESTPVAKADERRLDDDDLDFDEELAEELRVGY